METSVSHLSETFLLNTIAKRPRRVHSDPYPIDRASLAEPGQHLGRQFRQQRARQDLLDVAGPGGGFGAARGDRLDQHWVVVEPRPVRFAQALPDAAELQL